MSGDTNPLSSASGLSAASSFLLEGGACDTMVVASVKVCTRYVSELYLAALSAIIAVMYTLIGGLISVAYTDVFQLFFIAFGLVSYT